MDKLTQKQERFILNLFNGMSQRVAWIEAGYSSKYPVAVIDKNACLLAGQGKVKVRLAELNRKVEDDAISTEKERRKILTQIERATIGDFVDAFGNLDIVIDKMKFKSSAIQEIKTERTYKGVRTTLKLRDPVGAISEHNKMDKIYPEAGITNNDNRTLNIGEVKVVQFDAREVARAVLEAIRLGLNPEILGGNGHSQNAALLPTCTDIQATTLPQPEN